MLMLVEVGDRIGKLACRNSFFGKQIVPHRGRPLGLGKHLLRDLRTRQLFGISLIPIRPGCCRLYRSLTGRLGNAGECTTVSKSRTRTKNGQAGIS